MYFTNMRFSMESYKISIHLNFINKFELIVIKNTHILFRNNITTKGNTISLRLNFYSIAFIHRNKYSFFMFLIYV